MAQKGSKDLRQPDRNPTNGTKQGQKGWGGVNFLKRGGDTFGTYVLSNWTLTGQTGHQLPPHGKGNIERT